MRALPRHTQTRDVPTLLPTPAVKYNKVFRNGGSKQLPVLPSDHYGLLLELVPV